MSLSVLVACECSGVVCEAFNAYAGVSAVSCDILPRTDGRPDHHIQGEALEALQAGEWHAVIAHPPCTRMALSGALRLYRDGKKVNGRDPAKWEELDRATMFFRAFFEVHDGPLCVENPVMHGHARELIGEPVGVVRQTVQPYQFGDDASKATVLWLRGLPPLKPTQYIPPRMMNGRPRWGNQTDSGQNKLAPSATRAALRAVTYPGLAQAMAAQWVPHLLSLKQP